MDTNAQMNESPARRQCTATNRAGEPCRRAPILGGTVCAVHGGKAPQVIAAARLKLLRGRDLAIDALLRALDGDDSPCATCGRSNSDRDPAVIRAAQIVLDRTGFGPSASLTITPAPAADAEWMEWMSLDEMRVLDDLIHEGERRCRLQEPKPRDAMPQEEQFTLDSLSEAAKERLSVGVGLTTIKRIIVDSVPQRRSSVPLDGVCVEEDALKDG